MAQDSKLQIPISNKLKSGLKKKAELLGFSSANEAVRLLIQNFVNGNLSIQFISKQESVSMLDLPTEQRLLKNLQEIEQGEYDLIDFQKSPKSLKALLK